MSSPLNIWDEKEQKYVPLPCLKGEDGKDGTDGYTPQKGVDYFTDEDIKAINKAAAVIPGEGTNSIKQNYPGNWSPGEASVSIGPNVKTYGDYSIGIGRDLNIRDTSDGNINIDGTNSVNIGYNSKIYNQDGISLGRENKNYSHVGITAGYKNIAGLPEYADKQWGDDIARGAIAMGWENHATHAYACVLGDHNNSSRDGQTVFGRYCANDSDAVLIQGNGTSESNRSNLYTIDKDGNACFTGDVYVGSSKKDSAGSKRLATEEYTDDAVKNKIDDVKIGDTSIVKNCIANIPLFGTMNIDVKTYSEAGEIEVKPNTMYILSSANNDNKCGFYRTNKYDASDITSMEHRIVMLIAGQITEDIVEGTTKHKLHCYHVGVSKGTLSMNYDFYGADYVTEWYNLKLTYPAGATVTIIHNKPII